MAYQPSYIGTKVRNPMHRAGNRMFSRCCHCSKLYTPLGISRHWDKCPAKKEPANGHHR